MGRESLHSEGTKQDHADWVIHFPWVIPAGFWEGTAWVGSGHLPSPVPPDSESNPAAHL